VLEGDETKESPYDFNVAATLLFMERVVLLSAMEITKKNPPKNRL